jgi:hypothetical protein
MTGKLRAAYVEAMKFWDEQKANGVPFTDRVRALEGLLREVWPFTREWKFLCKTCDDTGLVIAVCAGDATCGRTKPHGPHDFGTPCWCSLGARFRPPQPPSPDDVEGAGKVKKSRTFARVGR